MFSNTIRFYITFSMFKIKYPLVEKSTRGFKKIKLSIDKRILSNLT